MSSTWLRHDGMCCSIMRQNAPTTHKEAFHPGAETPGTPSSRKPGDWKASQCSPITSHLALHVPAGEHWNTTQQDVAFPLTHPTGLGNSLLPPS